MSDYSVFVGLDVHKDTIAVAVADAGRMGEVRFWGEIANTPDAVASMLSKLGGRHPLMHFVYEAGPCGYSLHRQIMLTQHHCEVVSPAQTPRKPGDRIKTDRRDAMILARLSRAGELTSVWVPDTIHEAMRDLIRLRQAMVKDLRAARQRTKSFLLRYGRVFKGTSWKRSHRVWLGNQNFAHPAQQIAFQSYLNAVDQAQARRDEVDVQIRIFAADWAMAPVVTALQALRGVAFITAVTVVCEVGDIRRFDNLSYHLIQLPPYCPHLNPIERLWAVLHQYVTHNRHYPSQKQFADAILTFMRETIPQEWQKFRDKVSDNFRVITHENFRVLK